MGHGDLSRLTGVFGQARDLMKAYKPCGFPVEEGGTPRLLIPPPVPSEVRPPGMYLT